MRPKVFDKSREKPEFEVAGQRFTARAKLPFRAFVNLLDYLSDEDIGEVDKTQRFFRTVLSRDDRDRFLELLNRGGDDDADDVDDAEVIAGDEVSEITTWLVEYYTGKHQTSSPSSSDGASSTPPSPNVVSLNPRTATG